MNLAANLCLTPHGSLDRRGRWTNASTFPCASRGRRGHDATWPSRFHRASCSLSSTLSVGRLLAIYRSWTFDVSLVLLARVSFRTSDNCLDDPSRLPDASCTCISVSSLAPAPARDRAHDPNAARSR